MKKFIFGVMLLVSMLGIVGCANPSNFEDDTYIVKNGTIYEIAISYKNNSDTYGKEKNVLPGGTYEIPANDIKIYTKVIGMSPTGYSVGDLKVKKGDTEVEGFILKQELERGVIITQIITEAKGNPFITETYQR